MGGGGGGHLFQIIQILENPYKFSNLYYNTDS